MSGGGGGMPPPVQPVYTDPVNGMAFDTSSDLDNEVAARLAQEQATSIANSQSAAATAALNESTFQTNKANAINTATQGVDQYFKNQGLDPGNYKNDISNYINYDTNMVPDLSAAPQGYFSPNLGQQIVGDLTSGARTSAVNAVNNEFGPTFVNSSLPDSLIQPAVGNVLDSQFTPLASELTNAQKRGQLNQTGYDAANAALNTAKTGASATVSKLAQGVLAGDRTDLSTYIGNAGSAASNINLGTNFDASAYLPEANNMIGMDTSNFNGDVLNAVGPTKFSDITSLMNAGGAVQGANNPTAANPVGAVAPGGGAIGGGINPDYIAQQVLATQRRGLGSTGAY